MYVALCYSIFGMLYICVYNMRLCIYEQHETTYVQHGAVQNGETLKMRLLILYKLIDIFIIYKQHEDTYIQHDAICIQHEAILLFIIRYYSALIGFPQNSTTHV